jgi:hypothetical protein
MLPPSAARKVPALLTVPLLAICGRPARKLLSLTLPAAATRLPTSTRAEEPNSTPFGLTR